MFFCDFRCQHSIDTRFPDKRFAFQTKRGYYDNFSPAATAFEYSFYPFQSILSRVYFPEYTFQRLQLIFTEGIIADAANWFDSDCNIASHKFGAVSAGQDMLMACSIVGQYNQIKSFESKTRRSYATYIFFKDRIWTATGRSFKTCRMVFCISCRSAI